MKSRIPVRRVLMALVGGVVVPVVCGGLSCAGGAVSVYVENQCADNIHVNGLKVGPGERVPLETFPTNRRDDQVGTYPVTRDGLQLGELIVKVFSAGGPDENDDQGNVSATIVLREPSYFHITATIADGWQYLHANYVDLVEAK